MKKWYPEADKVLLHGIIYTVAITCDEVRAGKFDFPILRDAGVAIKDGKIIAVEASDALSSFIGEHTEVVDLQGCVVTPGFCESHMHCSFLGVALMELNLGGFTERAKVLERIAEFAKTQPKGKWITGNNWNNIVWDDQTIPTKEELDAAAPENPVFFMSATYHTACANSLALQLAGIDRDTPDPAGSTIGRRADGEPDGILYENAAMNLVQQAIPPKTDEDRIQAVMLAAKEMNSHGITAAIDCNLSYDQMRAYTLMKRQNKLNYRASLMLYLDSALGDVNYHLRRLEESYAVTDFGDDMLKLNGIKVTLDGVPSTFTSLMRKPYRLDPTTYGSTVWTKEEITAFVCKANELGWSFGIHAIGDATEDMAIEAFEAAHRQKPINEMRNYIIHYVIPHEDQWPRMKAMNISVTQQPTISCTLGELQAKNFQPEDELRNQGSGLMFKNGILCGGSSDCPVVTCDPIEAMYHAVTRIDETCGVVLDEECKVTPEQALIMYTKNSAYLMHADDRMGSVEVGNYADLVVLDREFLTDDPNDIRNAKVLQTILGGRVVYEA